MSDRFNHACNATYFIEHGPSMRAVFLLNHLKIFVIIMITIPSDPEMRAGESVKRKIRKSPRGALHGAAPGWSHYFITRKSA
mgnify:CR=1 FL=1